MRLRLPASNCRQIVDLLLLKMEIICNIAFPGCLVLQQDNPVVDLGQVEPGGEEGGRGDPHLAQPHLQGLWTLHLQVFFNVPDCWCIMTMDVSLAVCQQYKKKISRFLLHFPKISTQKNAEIINEKFKRCFQLVKKKSFILWCNCCSFEPSLKI